MSKGVCVKRQRRAPLTWLVPSACRAASARRAGRRSRGEPSSTALVSGGSDSSHGSARGLAARQGHNSRAQDATPQLRDQIRTECARNAHGASEPHGPAHIASPGLGGRLSQPPLDRASTNQFQNLLRAGARCSSAGPGVRKTLLARVLRTKYARRSGACVCRFRAARAYFVRTFCASRIVRCGHPNRTE